MLCTFNKKMKPNYTTGVNFNIWLKSSDIFQGLVIFLLVKLFTILIMKINMIAILINSINTNDDDNDNYNKNLSKKDNLIMTDDSNNSK